MTISKGLSAYNQVSVQSDLDSANPHRLIQKLLHAGLEKLSIAKGAMMRRDYAEKGRMIGWAISIIDGLRMSLDSEAGGEIAQNLESLYLYMRDQLLKANIENKVELIDEVSALLSEIHAAWNGIGEQVNNIAASSQPSTEQGLSFGA